MEEGRGGEVRAVKTSRVLARLFDRSRRIDYGIAFAVAALPIGPGRKAQTVCRTILALLLLARIGTNDLAAKQPMNGLAAPRNWELGPW